MAELAPIASAISIAPGDPMSPEMDLLFARHHEAMHADTPPQSIHMLPRKALSAPDITFLILRENGQAVGMAALKTLSPDHAEIKSMHLLHEARGRGLARALLTALIARARAAGVLRLSLETGAQPSFNPARKLYRAEGFADCPPFGDYRSDPNSTYMTLVLS